MFAMIKLLVNMAYFNYVWRFSFTRNRKKKRVERERERERERDFLRKGGQGACYRVIDLNFKIVLSFLKMKN